SALTAGKVVIVYVTAGDAGSSIVNPAFWQARETASKASVDAITPDGEWACASVTLNTHAIARCTKANVVTYYMHLPDGNGEGQGYGLGSLALLRTGGVASLTAIDGTTTYTSWADVLATMQALVASETAGQADIDVAVHVHDWDVNLNGGDHSDHRTTGDLMREAAVGRAWNLFWYIGYGSVFYDPNLTPAEYDIKGGTIVAYDNVMVTLMGETIIGTSHAEDWAQRTIYRGELSNGTPRPPIPPATPRAPTNLVTAPVAGLPRLQLTWTDNASDEQGFRIERAPDVGGTAGTYVQIASVAANVATYINTGLTAETRYWYRVRAYNAIGTSGYSNEQSGMVSAPRAPTALVGTPNANGVRVDLRWTDNSNDEQGFRIERAPDVAGVPGTYVQVNSVGANNVTFSNSGLTNGTTYWFRVRAYNQVGTSLYSNEVAVTTLTTSTAPSGLVATAVSGVRIDLTWIDNSTDETSFRVERAPDVAGAPGTFNQIASLGPNITTYGSTNLQNGTRYWYRVRAGNAAGFSAYSASVSATTFPVPITPSGLVATAVSHVRIDLTWTDNATDETAYRIERAPDVAGAPGTFNQIASIAANSTTYSNTTGLVGGTRYWYRIRAQNAIGNSPFSNIADATTLPTPAPNAPSALIATVVSGVRIDLDWTDNATDEQGFRVERAPDVGGVPGDYVQIAQVGVNVRSYNNTGLENGTRYWYRVYAFNAVGPSGFSNEVNALTQSPPAVPSGLIATTFSGVRIDLTWTDNATDEQGFRIERAPDAGGVPGAYVQIASVATPNLTTYSSTGLANGTRYWYRVRSYNAVGNSAYSTEADATTLSPPTPPSGLLAATISGVRIDLTWTDNATDEQGFHVQRAPDAGGVPGTFATISTIATPNTTTFSNTGLQNGTRYWYRVRAYNAVGNSAFTNETDATTLPAPAAPTNLQGTVVSSAVVDLSWVDNAGDETLFRIQRAPDVAGAPGAWANLSTVGANVTTYRATGLTAGTTYWFRVRAENTIGNSAYTAGTGVTTILVVPPSGLVANAYLVGTQRNVDLTWTPGSELTVDIFRNGTRIVSGRANDGGPFNNTPAASLGPSITYQICAAGKTGAENCSLVVTATF
ncbi:MAG TPA: fibronectin type III domain-containing protein, partial [Gemmatimonadales bacterium]|nr:fibronectin type III domain-containing protein [Gemmatimonadales bacterium]